MANVVVTLRIMPELPDTDLAVLEKQATDKISSFGGEVGKTEITPVAFGLNSLNLYFVMDEAKGSTEPLEKDVESLKGVNSVEVTDVRRAIG